MKHLLGLIMQLGRPILVLVLVLFGNNTIFGHGLVDLSATTGLPGLINGGDRIQAAQLQNGTIAGDTNKLVAIIYFQSKREYVKGKVRHLSDTSISLYITSEHIRNTDSLYFHGGNLDEKLLRKTNQTFHVVDIYKMKIRRRGAAGRGAGYGALIGFTSGFVLGAIMFKETDIGLEAGAIAFGSFGLPIGTLIGAGMGSPRWDSRTIKGDHSKWKRMLDMLDRRGWWADEP